MEKKSNKEQAIKEAARAKSYFTFRIHYIFSHKQTPDFWQTGCSTTMRSPNALARKGAIVEILS